MNKKFFAILLFGMFMTSAHAQVRKCTGPDGKVTYSDFVCAGNTANEAGVKTNANTIDASGMREESRRYKQAEAVEQAIQQGASRCKFASFKYGDSKGQDLAAAAKQECLSNLEAKVTGKPVSLEAYNFWKDHSTAKSADRRAAVAEMAAAANAQTIANSNRTAIEAVGAQNANRTIRCKPVAYQNALDCK